MKEIIFIEKYEPNKICSVLYKNAKSREFYIKRFIIETSTTEKKFSLVQDVPYSKIMLGTSGSNCYFQFNYITKKGEKKVKKIDIDNFVGIKNWKAIGNKIIGYVRLSGFKLIDSKAEPSIETKENNEKRIDDESIELTLF